MTNLIVNRRLFVIPDGIVEDFLDSIDIIESLAFKSKLKEDYLKEFNDVDNFKKSMQSLLELSRQNRKALDKISITEDELTMIINALYFERKNKKLGYESDIENLGLKLEELL